MASSTRFNVSGFTVPSLFITRETVLIETPAISATLLMVAAKFILSSKNWFNFQQLRTKYYLFVKKIFAASQSVM
jgi:hypothetical protein